MSRDVCKPPLLGRRREMSIVCDDCRFIDTKESRLRAKVGKAFPLRRCNLKTLMSIP